MNKRSQFLPLRKTRRELKRKLNRKLPKYDRINSEICCDAVDCDYTYLEKKKHMKKRRYYK